MGSLFTKDKRHEMFGRVAGGAGSIRPEHFQRYQIIQGTGIDCPKSNHMRIHFRTSTMVAMVHPNLQDNGFDYSEDFDGVQSIDKDTIIYLNLKCIVGKGGAQTRSLREIYWFIQGQLKVLQHQINNVYFANIIDGDEAHYNMSKFHHLLSLPEFKNIRYKVYVGDLRGYIHWVRQFFLGKEDDARSDTPDQMGSSCEHILSTLEIAEEIGSMSPSSCLL